MENETTKRPQWSSQLAFILSAIGSAIGLGNVWRFPYLMGKNGGAIFLFVYLFLILTICFIPLISELFIGKYTKKECVTALGSINPKLKVFGWLNVVTSIIIASFYFVVGGWIINYICLGFVKNNITDYTQYFEQFSAMPVLSSIMSILFLISCMVFIYRGVNKGIERGNKIMMPLLAVILIVLVIFSLSLPNANLGLEFMFKPDFSKISSSMVLAALGQSLFTLSIGMGALLTYGSYMQEKDDIIKASYTIVVADTAFAILAGVMIFPAVFAFGLEPTSGPGLVFITLPKIFAQMPCGNIISIMFFVLLFFAALTSGISILETPTATLMENLKISRNKAATILLFIIGILTVLATLSFGVLSDLKLFGKTIFDLMDTVSSNYLMPINTLIICITAGWLMKDKIFELFNNKYVRGLVKVVLKFIVPLALLLILTNN